MADDFQEKTEQPTDRRRQQVREEGNVARSVDLNAASLMLATTACLYFLGAQFVLAQSDLLKRTLRGPAWDQLDANLVVRYFWETGGLLMGSLLPWALLLTGVSLLVNLGQVGFMFSADVISLKWERLNPLTGVQRIASVAGVVRLLGSLLKFSVLATVGGMFLWDRLPSLLRMSELELLPAMRQCGEALAQLGFQLALALLALALADYGFQYWKFERDIRMTRQELRQELREMDGDPLLRQRRREARRKLTNAQQLARVRDADVVLTNPTELAVALKYDPRTMAAPIVIAKGAGELAARIRALAVQHRIPIIEKKPLAQALYKSVKVGQPVPVDLYEALIEIMAYVFRLSGKAEKFLNP